MFGCYTRNKVDNEMPNLTLENIANACEGTYVGDPSKKQKIITGAVTDSRKVEEGFLFIPIKGERVDGHDFIPSVFEKARWLCFPSMNWKIRQDHIFSWNLPQKQ